ncbi:MAG: ribokinase [Bullifex sp.]
MARVLSFGSLNIDQVFRVEHIVREGETITSSSVKKSAGGKGGNQSAALAKAGAEVYHAGKIGSDGVFITELLAGYGVDVSLTEVASGFSGQAIIQVDDDGENSIVLYPGENRNITEEEVDKVFSHFSSGDWLVIQNETNALELMMEKAHEKGMTICFNPAPFDESVRKLPLEYVSVLIVNETEGAGLSGVSSSYEETLSALHEMYPAAIVVLTMGDKGSLSAAYDRVFYQEAFQTDAVDTTAAGDTFLGYFVAERIRDASIPEALCTAAAASALTVSASGAMESIPYLKQVEERKKCIR